MKTFPSLNNIQNVQVTSPTSGDLLTWDGTHWINTVPPATVMPGYRQVFIATLNQVTFGPLLQEYVPNGGQLSVYINGIKQYPSTYTESSPTVFILSTPSRLGDEVLAEISSVEPSFITPITQLADLHDVALTTPTTDDVLKYDGVTWVNSTLPPSTTELALLTDVALTTPTTNDMLTFNGTAWVNSIPPTPITQLADLHDVALTTPTTDDVLKYDGVTWVNSTLPPSTTELALLTDVALTTPTTDDVLKYDGVTWVNSPAPAGSIIFWNPTDHTLYGPTAVGGIYNTVYGSGALATPSNPSNAGYNTVVGYNTVMGYNAATNMTGSYNVMVGYYTGQQSSGASNVGIGSHAMSETTTGFNNVAVGSNALRANTIGTSNTAVGSEAGASLTTGHQNTVMGYYALRSATDAHLNVAIGTDASSLNTSGSYNTSVGSNALFGNTTGSYNVVVGWCAGQDLTTGSNNVLVGGYYGTAGMDGNIILSTGDGIVRLQHDGTNWKTSTPITTSVASLGNITGAVSANATTSDFYYGTVTGATTWTFSGTLTSGVLYSMTLELTNPGAFAQTWPASVKWSNGTLPSLTVAGLDVLEFYTRDGGTTWRGFQSGKDMK